MLIYFYFRNKLIFSISAILTKILLENKLHLSANTVVCFIMGGNGVSELSIALKSMSQKDLAGDKRILQMESLHCFLMESSSSFSSTCTDDIGNCFGHLKVTAFNP
jgi:hypothetical protein